MHKYQAPFLAILYSFLATASSLSMAEFEGLLVEDIFTTYEGKSVIVSRFLENFSTLLDFSILNPLVIYFFTKAAFDMTKVQAITSLAHYPEFVRWGWMLVSVTISAFITWYYFLEFFSGDYFDAIINPLEIGVLKVTLTGWVVFFWTVLFGSYVLYRLIDQFYYVRHLLSMADQDITYHPFHSDTVGGLRPLMQPALSFALAMTFILCIFVVFILFDRVVNNIEESNRTRVSLIYLGLVGPLFFLPYWHIHRIMILKREQYLHKFEITSADTLALINLNNPPGDKVIASELMNIDKASRTYNSILSFPVWPLPNLNMLIPLASSLVSIYPSVSSFVSFF